MTIRSVLNLVRVALLGSLELGLRAVQLAAYLLLAVGGAGLLVVGGALLVAVLTIGSVMRAARRARTRVGRVRTDLGSRRWVH